ncbi:hypothetical protein [Flavobacterium sp. 3HN19-14]|uniref:hypothetical protein n=1 Tax=Flavobacterium sp. 3HN19-14 TaxID=3448133 RepID=UPI003EE34F9F
MKKILFILIALFCVNGFGQTILSSHYLKLNKPVSKQQFLTAVNKGNQQVFVFASDKENQTCYKYNSALFYKDSLSTLRPDNDEYASLSGFSFDKAGNPEIYWTSDDYKKILASHYDFESKKATSIPYTLDFNGEEITNSFSENNIFYVITLEKTKPLLKIYMLHDGQMEVKTLDFSPYSFIDNDNSIVGFEKIIERNPIEKVDTKTLNPLLTGVSKSKLYVYDDKFVLALDYNTALTQVLEIDLSTFSISEKSVVKPVLKKAAKSNSYYMDGKLYQFVVNDTEMALSAIDLNTGVLPLKTYNISENDSIAFSNSPLYSQTGNHRSRELKNTKKFLRRVSDSDIGLTVYKTPNDILLTVGGIREVASTGGIILGVTVGVGMVMTGTGAPIDGLLDNETQAVYFEGLFDESFEHKNLEQQRLASDYISQFLQDHYAISNEIIFPYKDFFIMGYYDSDAKQYIMRKFRDDGFND